MLDDDAVIEIFKDGHTVEYASQHFHVHEDLLILKLEEMKKKMGKDFPFDLARLPRNMVYMYIPYSTAKLIVSEFEKELKGHSVNKYIVGDRINVYLLDDSLAILVELVGYIASPCSNADQQYKAHKVNPYLEFPKKGREYFFTRIEELTPNVIGFQYNNTKFLKRLGSITGINYLDLNVEFSRYTSYRDEFWIYYAPNVNPDATSRIDELLPELQLKERCKAWKGDHYYFTVLELDGSDGVISRAVAYTTTKPHNYVLNICNEWIRTGYLRGAAVMHYGTQQGDINKAFKSWKGIRRQERLEDHLKYFFVEKDFQDKVDAIHYASDVLNDTIAGKYDGEERSTYLRPINKWKSEELVFKLTKKIYGKKHAVIYQHRPFFLKSPKNGQMSYDVFISELNVAIEYQGKQHFEPVDFFGGKEAFNDLVIRDKEKLRLSKMHGIKLVYINHWEEITPDLIREKVES